MIKVLVLIVITFSSCTVILTSDNFLNQKFVSARTHVNAESYLYFNDSTYIYNIRNGTYYSKGTWKVSNDGKFIIINSEAKWDTTKYYQDSKKVKVLTFRRFENEKVKIIDSRTLDFNDKIFKLLPSDLRSPH